MKKFNTIYSVLFEDIIGRFKDNVEIVYDVDKTKHGAERQSRHQEIEISNEQITSAINTAMDQIAEALIFNKIDIGDRIWIYDSLSNLNVIIATGKSGDKIQIHVITVMITPDFNNKFNTYKVVI